MCCYFVEFLQSSVGVPFFFLSSSLNEGLFVYSMFVMPEEFW